MKIFGWPDLSLLSVEHIIRSQVFTRAGQGTHRFSNIITDGSNARDLLVIWVEFKAEYSLK